MLPGSWNTWPSAVPYGYKYDKEEVYNITMVDAEVRIGDEVIATASLKSAVKDD